MKKNENYFVDYRSKIIRIKNSSESKSKSKPKLKSKNISKTNSKVKSSSKLKENLNTQGHNISKNTNVYNIDNNDKVKINLIQKSKEISSITENNNIRNKKKSEQYSMRSNMGKFISSDESQNNDTKMNLQKDFSNISDKTNNECQAILNKYGDLLRSSNLNIKLHNDKFVIKEEKYTNLNNQIKNTSRGNSSRKKINKSKNKSSNKSYSSIDKSFLSNKHKKIITNHSKSPSNYSKSKINNIEKSNVNSNILKHSPNYSLMTVNTNTICNNTDINDKQLTTNYENKTIIQNKVYNINKHLGESSERSIIYSSFKDYNQEMKINNSKTASKSKSVNQSKIKNAQVKNNSKLITTNSKSNISLSNNTDHSINNSKNYHNINNNNNKDIKSYVNHELKYYKNKNEAIENESNFPKYGSKPQLFLQLIKTYMQKISSLSYEINSSMNNSNFSVIPLVNNNLNKFNSEMENTSDIINIKSQLENLHETIAKFNSIVNSESVEKLLTSNENEKPKLIDENILKKYQKEKNYDLIENQIVEVNKENSMLKNELNSLVKLNNENLKTIKTSKKEKEELMILIKNLQEKNSILNSKLKNQENMSKEIDILNIKNKLLEKELNEKCYQLECDINKSIKFNKNLEINTHNYGINEYSEKEYNLNSKSTKSEFSNSIRQNDLTKNQQNNHITLNSNNKINNINNTSNANNNKIQTRNQIQSKSNCKLKENEDSYNNECTGNNSMFNKTYKVKPGGNIKDFYMNFQEKNNNINNPVTTRRNKSSDMSSKVKSTNINNNDNSNQIKNQILIDNFHIVNYDNNLNKSLTKSQNSNSNSHHSDKSKEKLNQGNFKKNLEKVLNENSIINKQNSTSNINNNSNSSKTLTKEIQYYEDNRTDNHVATNLINNSKNKNILYSFGNTLINTARNSPEPFSVIKEENSLLKSITFKEEMDCLDNEIKKLHNKLEYIAKD